jgi:hypothetical protein
MPEGVVIAMMNHTEEVIDKRVGEIREDLDKRFDNLDQSIADLTRLIKAGFPDDDPHSHRKFHEGLIEEAADRRETSKDIKRKLVVGTVWGGGLLLANAIWDYIKAHLK